MKKQQKKKVFFNLSILNKKKKERGKSFNTSGHDLKPSLQSLFVCFFFFFCESNKKSIKGKILFFLNVKKEKKRQFMQNKIK